MAYELLLTLLNYMLTAFILFDLFYRGGTPNYTIVSVYLIFIAGFFAGAGVLDLAIGFGAIVKSLQIVVPT